MKKSRYGILGIFSNFFLGTTLLIINPALDGIAAMFPEIPYGTVLLLATAPNLVVAFTSLMIGRIAGKRISYRSISALAGVGLVVTGMTPFLLRNFWIILVCRILFGFFVGLATPLGNALIMRLYDGQERAKMLGIGSAMMCVAGIFYQIISGKTAVSDPRNAWLTHLIILIPTILILLFMPNVREDGAEDSGDSEKKGMEEKLPCSVYLLSVVFGITFMAFYPLMLNMSSIVAVRQVGDAAVSGNILTMYSLGGAIGGVVFGLLNQKAGKWTIPVLYALLAGGLGICAVSDSVIFLMIGTFCTGAAIFMLASAILDKVAEHVSQQQSAKASGVMMAIWNLGTFLSSFYVSLIIRVTGTDNPTMPVIAAAMIELILLVGWGVYSASTSRIVKS